MDKIKIIAGFVTFAAVIALAYIAYGWLGGQEAVHAPGPASPPAEQAARTGGQAADTDERVPAPDFTVQDMDGEAVKLSDHFGKPIVLNFWASWCPPCTMEMPDFEKVFIEMGEEIKFMMVNLADGARETVESGKEYVAGEGFTFPVYFDTEMEAAYAYGIRSIPTTVFIDRDGNIVTGAQGAISEATLRLGIGYIE